MGTGKMMVLLFSAEMLFSVCRYLSWKDNDEDGDVGGAGDDGECCLASAGSARKSLHLELQNIESSGFSYWQRMTD